MMDEEPSDSDTSSDSLHLTYLPVFLPGSKKPKKQRRKMELTSWVCIQCDKEFKDKETLRDHQAACVKEENKNVSADKRRWQCHQCDKSYTKRSTLWIHVNATHKKYSVEEKPTSVNEIKGSKKLWPCEKCKKGYTQRRNLQRHVSTKHVQGSDEEPLGKRLKQQKYPCLFCKKVLFDVVGHCRVAHNINHPEQLLFKNEKSKCCKESEEVEGRYNNTCRLCNFDICVIEFDNSELLMAHYVSDHNIGHDYLNVTKNICSNQEVTRDAKNKGVVEVGSETNGEEVIERTHARVNYKCKCGIAVESYEKCVKHSQDHLVANNKADNEVCDICKFSFETSILAEHVLEHDVDADVPDALVINYDFETLLSEAWFETFKDLPESQRNEILLSPYRHFRSVRMHLEESEGHDICTGGALYQCMMCDLYVDPAKVENHCKNYNSCVKNKPKAHSCGTCSRSFYSSNALTVHTNNRDTNFKLVKFNSKEDTDTNKILDNLQNLLNSGSQKSITSKEVQKMKPTSTYSKQWYCKICQECVDASAIERHPHALKMIIRTSNYEKTTKTKEDSEKQVAHDDDHDNGRIIDEAAVESNGRDASDSDSSTSAESGMSPTHDYVANKTLKENSVEFNKLLLEIKIRSDISRAKASQPTTSDKDHNDNNLPQSTQDLLHILEDGTNPEEEVQKFFCEDEEKIAEANEECEILSYIEHTSVQDLRDIDASDNEIKHQQEVSESSSTDEEDLSEPNTELGNSNKAIFSSQDLLNILESDVSNEITRQDISEVSNDIGGDVDPDIIVIEDDELEEENDESPNATDDDSGNRMIMTGRKLLTDGYMMLNMTY